MKTVVRSNSTNPIYWALMSLVTVACSQSWVEDSSPAPTEYLVSTAVVETPFVDKAAAWNLTRIHTGGGPEKRYIVEAKGGGAALLDAEGDGDLDIYWVNGASLATPDLGGGNALYRNDGEVGFVDIAAAAGVEGHGWGMGAQSADYDNDGDQDLYITCLRDNILYRNDGRGRFADQTEQAGVAMPLWSTGAAMGDADLDGDLDLYVANYVEFSVDEIRPLGTQWKGRDVFVGPLSLPASPDVLYRNEGDGTFVDMTGASGIGRHEPGYGFGVLFVDLDDDGDQDLYIANDSTPNFLYRNAGDGTFVEVGLRANAAFNEMGLAQAGMGVAWGDYDGDGDGDLFVTNFEDDYNTLYRNAGGTFTDISFAVDLGRVSLPYVGFGAVFLDYDNDADQDLFVANGHVYPQIESPEGSATYPQKNHLFANDGGRFNLVDPVVGPKMAAGVSRGAVAGDFDDDGRLDLFVTNLNGRPSLLYNNTETGHHWLGVHLRGHTQNREGVGARVFVWSEGRRQRRDVLCGESFLGSGDRRLHFGLAAGSADSMHVYWPGGALQRVTDLPLDSYVLVEQEQ